MSSGTDTNSDDNQDDERLINALTTREIRRGLVNSDLDIDEDATRKEVLTALQTRPDADQLRQDIIEGAKERILEDDHVKVDNIEGAGQGFAVIQGNLNLRETYYYDSYFRYTDRTARVYKIPELGGVLSEIANAESSVAAQEMFTEHSEGNNLDDAYVQAAEDVPAPLIGNVDDSFRPRLVEFEDSNTIYVTYWKRGKTWSALDVRTGDYEKIKTLFQAILRVDLETGLIEMMSDDSQKSHKKLVERFLSEFNDNNTAVSINIRGPDIRRAKKNLSILTSLNEFVGDEAKVRLTRNRARSVEADPANSQMESQRDYSRSNFQILIGQESGGNDWNLVNRVNIDVLDEEDEEVSMEDVISAVEEDYDDVLPLTISLDSEKSTFRIRKKALTPSTRRQVFNLLADELNWT